MTKIAKINEAEIQQSDAPNSGATILQFIQQAAQNPNVDIDKMERLLQMHETIVGREQEQAFNTAMMQAQKQIPTVLNNRKNDQTKSGYADLETVNKTISPIIAENGFSTSFGTDKSPLDEHYRITCKVSHIDGYSRDYQADIPFDSAGLKGSKNKTNTHAFGSTMTYGRRYLNLLIWNISTSDDDGNLAGAGETITQEQVKELSDLIEKTETPIEVFCAHLKIDSLSSMPLNRYGNAEKQLTAKLKKMNKASSND